LTEREKNSKNKIKNAKLFQLFAGDGKRVSVRVRVRDRR
jgi:hypothetical protein